MGWIFSDYLVVTELGMEPGACELPVAHDSFGRDGQHFSGFIHAQPAKKTQLDNAGLAGVILCQGVQGIFEGDQLPCPISAEVRQLIEVDLLGGTASFGGDTASSAVEQDVAHDLCRDGKEMRPVLPSHVVDVDELEVGLVDEGRGLHGVPSALVLHLVSSDATEGAIDAGSQLLERSRIAISPRTKKLGRFRRLVVFATG
jgi:hypothetical protein